MAAHNSYPKPFVSQLLNDVKQVPRIMVNNQQVNGSISGSYQNHQGPTSTVHKSMVHSRQYGQNQYQASATYSRLISPTISQGSLSPQSGTEFAQHRNQQQQQETGRVSWASATPMAPKEHQLYNQDQQSGLLNYSEQPQQMKSSDQQQQQHQINHQQYHHQQANLDQGEFSHEVKPAIVAEEPIDYKELLNRISPSSPRNPNNVLLPDDRRDGFMRDKQLERMTIAHQTYRTTPIVLAKPKARHDLATGSYMHLNQDPTWDLLEKSSGHHQHHHDHAIKFQQASKGYHQPKINNANEIINSLPRSAPNSSINVNNITGFVGARAAAAAPPPATGRYEQYQSQGHHQHQATHQRCLDQDSVPVFNYRDYIESTRRAR